MRIKGLWGLVSALLQKDPAQRPNAEEAAKRLQNIINEAAFVKLPLKYQG